MYMHKSTEGLKKKENNPFLMEFSVFAVFTIDQSNVIVILWVQLARGVCTTAHCALLTGFYIAVESNFMMFFKIGSCS